jgi:hypothetical protein
MSYGSETSDMTSEGLGEMFEGDSAEMCAEKFSARVDGGTSGPSIVRRRGARTPIGASGNFLCIFRNFLRICKKWWPLLKNALKLMKFCLVAPEV